MQRFLEGSQFQNYSVVATWVKDIGWEEILIYSQHVLPVQDNIFNHVNNSFDFHDGDAALLLGVFSVLASGKLWIVLESRNKESH